MSRIKFEETVTVLGMDAKEQNLKILGVIPVSENEADGYLAYVLVRRDSDEYATYLYNSSQRGFSTGHYFDDKRMAFDDLLNRGK